MATIINMGEGSIPPVLLASVTSIPTSGTAVNGTKNWKKFDAIYFVIKMHYNSEASTSKYTSLILTKTVVIDDRYNFFRQGASDSSGSEASLFCWFYNDQIKISKLKVGQYDVVSVDIYGVNF